MVVLKSLLYTVLENPIKTYFYCNMRLPKWRMVKNPLASAGDTGLISGLGRSPGRGNGNPLQYSCLENPKDRGAWWASIHEISKSWTWLSTLYCAPFIRLHSIAISLRSLQGQPNSYKQQSFYRWWEMFKPCFYTLYWILKIQISTFNNCIDILFYFLLISSLCIKSGTLSLW